MHLTSAPILTLLSASTVLAVYPYAGFRVASRNWFKSVSADVLLPSIWLCQCNSDFPQIAFIGIGMGDPITCGNRGVEAGVAIMCDVDRSTHYVPYAKMWPHEEELVDTSQFPIAEGDTIRIEIWVQDATEEYTIWVSIENLTQHGHLAQSTAGSAFDIVHCIRTAAWVLRAEQVGQTLLPVPDFSHIYFTNAWAEDNVRVHLPGSSDAEVLWMVDSGMWVLARPAHHPDNLYPGTDNVIDTGTFDII